jgi:hypothetical protein
MKRASFEKAEKAVYDLLATLAQKGIFEFPGASELGLKPEDIRCTALALACQCAKRRAINGEINERLEGRLEAMHLYAVDLKDLQKFVASFP